MAFTAICNWRSPALKNRQPLRRYLTKTLRVMQLTAALLLIFALSLSARTSSQTITLTGKDLTMHQVFAAIKSQTGYYLINNRAHFNMEEKINVDVANMEIATFLTLIFKEKPYDFEIKASNIFVRNKKGRPSIVENINAEFPPITGFVRGPDGQPLAGVNIIVKGTKKGVTTNADGSFSIDAKEGDVLVISNVGFQIREVIIGKDNLLGIMTLAIENKELEEVTFTNKGYYAIKRELNTGTVSRMGEKDIEKQPVNNFLGALEGNIPGLQITHISGVPGADMRVRLRGTNSIANGNDPLYIVDGVPFSAKTFVGGAGTSLTPLTSIRPEDIENIDVLKDADATAIYGSRGANGVILITTKRGKAGRTIVQGNGYTAFGKVPRKLDLMNTDEYLQMRREALKNDGISPQDYEYDLNGTWDTTAYTDWQKVMIGRTSKTVNANASVSGGNEYTKFFFGNSYRRETTVYPGDYFNQIGSGVLNINHRSENKRFTADVSVSYSINNNKLPQSDFSASILSAPNTPNLYNPDGSLNWANSTWYHPLAETKISSTLNMKNLISNLAIGYEIVEGLQLKSTFGYTTNIGKNLVLSPFTAFDPAYSAFANDYRSQERRTNDNRTWIIEPQLNYNVSFGDHHLDALIGTTMQSSFTESTAQAVSGFNSDALITNFAAGTTILSSYYNSIEYKYSALYARLGYNYKEKYIINFTSRRDGSTRFGPGRKFGNFGAVGGAWLFHKENLIKNNLTFLSSGKLKASMGKTGNDQLPDYSYLTFYNPQSNLTYAGAGVLVPSGLANPFYGWETINKIEAGVELGFFDNRFQLNVNYYKNRTSNQLVGYSLSTVTGYPSIIANLPAVIQNNGLEFEISSTNISGRNFKWTTSVNFSAPKNKLVAFPGLASTGYSASYAIGLPLSTRYNYVSQGVDPQTGVYKFEDVNKDGSITFLYDRVPVFYGIKYSGGISNSISYAGFSVDLMLHFVKQRGINGEINKFTPGIGVNQQKGISDRWVSAQRLGKYQKYAASFGDAFNAYELYTGSDAVAADASYLRLRNVMLQWTVPMEVLNNLKLSSLSLYAQGQNILTITKFKGLDPETNSMGGYGLPPLRVFTLGLRIGL